jgi:hypothetical protein
VEVLSEQQCPLAKLVLELEPVLELARAQVLAQVAARVLQQV